jgi:hypothetical protein
MLKKIIVTIALVVIVGVLVFGAVNRSLAKVNEETSTLNQNEYETTNYTSDDFQRDGKNDLIQIENEDHANEQIVLPPASEDKLSDDEVAGLLYMWEEEKLAHDVYVNFYSEFETRNFQNISESELTHIESVKTLIDRYGLTDLASSEMGVFINSDLQALYNELVVRGGQSLAEALRVGAAIEEIDILDLKERLAQTDNADIQIVYENLMVGSENHLRAFVAKFQLQTGEPYQPQYLSLDAYQAIIDGDTQVGGSNQGGGNGIGGPQENQP